MLELGAGLDDLSLRGPDRRFGLGEARLGKIPLVHGDQSLGVKVGDPSGIRPGVPEVCLELGDVGLADLDGGPRHVEPGLEVLQVAPRSHDLRLEDLRVELRQDLAVAHA